jgi:hypothetical protein
MGESIGNGCRFHPGCPGFKAAKVPLGVPGHVLAFGRADICTRCECSISAHGPIRGPGWFEMPLMRVGRIVIFKRSVLLAGPAAVLLIILAITAVKIHATSTLNGQEAAVFGDFLKFFALLIAVLILSTSSPPIHKILQVTVKTVFILGIISAVIIFIYLRSQHQ